VSCRPKSAELRGRVIRVLLGLSAERLPISLGNAPLLRESLGEPLGEALYEAPGEAVTR